MRKYLISFGLLLSLSACVSTGSKVGLPSTGQIAGAISDISTNIGLACNSANQLLSLPGTQAGVAAGLAKVALSAAKLSSKIDAYCALGQLAGPVLSAALSQVNTAGAQLLGTGVAKQ